MPNQNPEQLARDKIDAVLMQCGWVIQKKNQINLNAAIGIAIREYQTNVGPADYVLFVDKETRDYRTPKTNSVFLYFARLKQVLAENKNGKTDCNINFPASVVWGGIEPPTQGFSVLCSTN